MLNVVYCCWILNAEHVEYCMLHRVSCFSCCMLHVECCIMLSYTNSYDKHQFWAVMESIWWFIEDWCQVTNSPYMKESCLVIQSNFLLRFISYYEKGNPKHNQRDNGVKLKLRKKKRKWSYKFRKYELFNLRDLGPKVCKKEDVKARQNVKLFWFYCSNLS